MFGVIKDMDACNIVKRKDGVKEKVVFRILDESYLDKIMSLQENIVEGLDDKQLYAPSERKEFEEYIKGIGKIIGCITEEDKLIAIGVYGKLKLDKRNYGYDIDVPEEELIKVGQIESTIVDNNYRGNGLQRMICNILEQIAIEDNIEIITATVSPFNKYSLNSFISLDYKIVKEKLKYGGLKRYILRKVLNSIQN